MDMVQTIFVFCAEIPNGVQKYIIHFAYKIDRLFTPLGISTQNNEY